MESKKKRRKYRSRKPEMLGVWRESEPLLEVYQSGELLSPVEYKRKYPHGTILHIMYREVPVMGVYT